MKKTKLSGKAKCPPGLITHVLRIMKLTAIFMLGICLQVSAAAYSQQTRITLNAKRMHLTKVLQAIEEQGRVRFVYNNDVLPNNEFISINVKDQPLDEVLSTILRNTDLTFKALDKELIVIAPGTYAIRNVKVTGKITDAKGNPLPGVSVQVQGTSKGTVTDANGTYTIDAPGNSTLVFSYIGFLQQKVAVNDRARIDLVLQEDTKGLNEVVVVGYGTQKKVNLTGSVATVSADKLASRPVTSVQNALQGLVPGVTVLSRPEDVGRDAGTITVRGRTNLSAPGPMIIIDGIPSTDRDMAALNPNDIENMSVLKDAASASIYGSRAANGVILITTKRGKEGKMNIDVNASYGVSSPTLLPNYLGSADYARLYNEARLNAGKTALFTPQQIQKFENGSDPDNYPNTDWYKEALRKNPSYKDFQIGMNGSSKNTTYYLSLAYMNQQSLVPTKALDRYTARLNTSTQVLPILNIGTNFAFVKQDMNNRGDEMNFTELNRAVPTLVARQSDGSWGTVNAGRTDATLSKNNVLRNNLEGGRGYDKSNAFTGSVNGTLTPLKGLSVRGLASLKIDNRTANRFWNTMPALVDFISKKELDATARQINEMQEKWSQRQALLLQAYAEYEKTINRHSSKIMAGMSQESNVFRDIYVGRRNFPTNGLGAVGGGSGSPEDISTGDELKLLSPDGTSGQGANGSYSESWAIRSFFGRFNYSFADRYLLELNLRRDLSSRFHKDNRNAWFPSMSAAWRISEESFMRDVKWVSNLKLRGSYGTLGNENSTPVGNYENYLVNDQNYYSFEGVPVNGIYQKNASNRATSWEKVKMTNIGLDASFLKGKLDVTVDYFIKKTDGILIKRDNPATFGLEPAWINGGSTRNRGIELTLSHSNTIGKDFHYDVTVNVSKIKNEIIDMGGVDSRISGFYIEKVGESVGAFFGYETDGLYTEEDEKNNYPKLYAQTKPGDIKYRDANNDGVINQDDRRVLGNDVPWFNYGINLNLGYKGIDFSVITYGVSDVDIYLNNEASYAFFNGAGVKSYHMQRWTKENPDPRAAYPRLLIGADATQNNNQNSSFWLYNAAYFRIRAISLGYTLPAKWTKRAAMQSARIYLSANNPFTIMSDKRLKDYDPEMSSGRGTYPGVKTWAVGVNVKF